MTQDHRFLRLPPCVISDILHHTQWRSLVSSMVAEMSLNLVWAPVFHTEGYQHHLEVGMIDEVLRHSPERAPSEQSPCALCQAHQHPKTMWWISHQAKIFPRTRGSEPKLEGGTFSPSLIPSQAMNCQPLSQPRMLKNQSLVYSTPKPGLSNLAHFITPVIRALLPQRTTCSVHSRFMPTLHPVQCISARLCSWNSRDQYVSCTCPRNLQCLSAELPTAACGEGKRRNGGLMRQELQDERHPHKCNPDGGIDGWMSREESLSHPFCRLSFNSVSFCGGCSDIGYIWVHDVSEYNKMYTLYLYTDWGVLETIQFIFKFNLTSKGVICTMLLL